MFLKVVFTCKNCEKYIQDEIKKKEDPNNPWVWLTSYSRIPVCIARICKRLRSPGIDSKESIPLAYFSSADQYDKYSCRTSPLGYRLAESIPLHRFLGSLNVYKFGLCLQFSAALLNSTALKQVHYSKFVSFA